MKSNITIRQTIKGSIYNYIGIGFGCLNVMLLMPMFLTPSEIGLTQLLLACSGIASQFGTLGFTFTIIRTFPKFRNKENHHNGFGFLIAIVAVAGFILTLIYYYIDKDRLIRNNIEKSPLFADYIYLLIPFFFSKILLLLFDAYNKILFNASFGIFMKEFFIRALNTIGILLFYFKIFDYELFIYFFTAINALPAIAIIILLFIKKELSFVPDFSIFRNNKGLLKEVFSITSWGFFTGALGVLWQFDKVFINSMIDLHAVGIYSVAFLFGGTIYIPYLAYERSATSIIAQAFVDNNIEKVKQVYFNSVIFLTFIGTLLAICVLGNINNIMLILKPEYAQGKDVLFYSVLAHLFMQFVGVGSSVLGFGKYFRRVTFIFLVCDIIRLPLIFLLIPRFGLLGAALVPVIATVISNFILIFYIKAKYKFQPYNLKFVFLVAIGLFTYMISLLLPQLNLFVDIALRSVLIIIIYLVPIYFLKIVPELNAFADYSFQIITKRLKKIA